MLACYSGCFTIACYIATRAATRTAQAGFSGAGCVVALSGKGLHSTQPHWENDFRQGCRRFSLRKFRSSLRCMGCVHFWTHLCVQVALVRIRTKPRQICRVFGTTHLCGFPMNRWRSYKRNPCSERVQLLAGHGNFPDTQKAENPANRASICWWAGQPLMLWMAA